VEAWVIVRSQDSLNIVDVPSARLILNVCDHGLLSCASLGWACSSAIANSASAASLSNIHAIKSKRHPVKVRNRVAVACWWFA
jgi:hypothetical protein